MESQNQNAEYVKLNVGGNMFCTSVKTLKLGDTMLSAMFSGRMPLVRTQDGSVFIDRDGTHFGTILNFLRDGKIVKPKTEQKIEELKIEAQFYCITNLVTYCENIQLEDEFGDDTIMVWPTVLKSDDGGIKSSYYSSRDGAIKVPLMADGSMSLSVLRQIFPSAAGLGTGLIQEARVSGVSQMKFVQIEMLKCRGVKIYQPKQGWDQQGNREGYFILHIQ